MNQKNKFNLSEKASPLTSQEAKKYFSIFGFAVLGFAITFLLFGSLAFFVADGILASKSLSFDTIGIWGQILSNLISSVLPIALFGAPVFVLLLKPLPTVNPSKSSLSFKQLLGGFCVAMLFMYIGSYFSTIFLTIFSSISGIVPENALAESLDGENLWVTFAFTVIIAPVLEEFLFRKLLCGKLLALGEGYAVFLSALAFSVIHANFYQVAYAFLVGAFLGYIYIKTGKLIYPLIYHMLLNFFGTVFNTFLLRRIDQDALLGIYDPETLEQLMSSTTIDPNDPLVKAILILGIYELILMVIYVIGLFVFWRAVRRKKITFEKGLLSPPKKGFFSNLLCNPGIAAAFVFFTAIFIISLL